MSVKSKIQALIAAANTATGESDATLTDAVQTLVDGYGQGGGEWTTDGIASGIEPIGAITVGATRIRRYGFAYATKLTVVHLTDTNVSQNAFQNCDGLTIIAGKARDLESSIVILCKKIHTIDVSANRIYAYCFQQSSLSTLVLRNTNTLVNLLDKTAFNATVFASGGAGGTLYVPQALIANYQSATNWSTILGYANNQILPIEGSIYETQYADGTPIT